MISTVLPRGAINEREVQFLTFSPRKDKFYVVDNASNRWQVDELEFNRLQQLGFVVKEVRMK